LWSNMLLAFILGLLPISEIRGGVLYVFASSKSPIELLVGLLLSLSGNLLVPFLAYGALDLLDHAFRSKHTPLVIKKAYLLALDYGRRRAGSVSGKGYLALALFVSVPLPVTGAWTGTLVAYVLGLDRRKSTIAIELGVLIAATIVTLVVALGLEVLRRVFLL
jgi:uncharacterized membrane protein